MRTIIQKRAAALRRRALPYLFLCASLAAACGHTIAKSCERPAQLRFSVIPQGGAQQDISSLQPLLSALEEALRIPVVVVKARSYGAVAEGLLSGSVDLARLGPASYVKAKRQDPRMTAFASYARSPDIFNREGANYYSLLIVHASSQVSNFQALRGRKLALVDPDSTSGAVIPRHMALQKTGTSLEKFFGHVLYTGRHDASVQALLRNDVQAAFISSSHLSDLVAAKKVSMNELRILWRSASIPRDPFVYRGQLCEEIKKKIASVFLEQDGRSHASVLKDLNATRFLAVSDQDYQVLRSAYADR